MHKIFICKEIKQTYLMYENILLGVISINKKKNKLIGPNKQLVINIITC